MRLEIACATPSLNSFAKQHWTVYEKIKKKWLQLIWAARCESHAGRPAMMKHAVLTIERYGPKLLDYDNLVGGTKPVTDCLVKLEYIEADDSAHLTTSVQQHLCSTPRTVLTLELA